MAAYPDALLACERHTLAELEVYRPGLVVYLGRDAAEGTFGKKSMRVLRGRFRAHDGRVETVTYHPAATLRGRSPEAFPLLVNDLIKAREKWERLP